MDDNSPRQKNCGLKRGFTLIEILLVVSLIAIIGLAVYQSLANGIKVWKYSLHYDVGEDAAIALDKFGHDVRNAFEYSQIPFGGDDRRFSFPAIVRTTTDRKIIGRFGPQMTQVGKVEYFFDSAQQGFCRRQANYSQALKKNKFGKARLLISSVASAKFTYYFMEDGKIQIKKKITENTIPVAVRLDLQLTEGSGSQRKISQLFNIPVQE